MPCVGCLIEVNIVENKELRFGANEARIGDTRILEIVDGFFCNIPWIATVILPRNWILDIANDCDGRNSGKRINKGSFCFWNDQHVAFVNRLPSADARTVETQSSLEDGFFKLVDGYGEMLPKPRKIYKAQINCFDIFFSA